MKLTFEMVAQTETSVVTDRLIIEDSVINTAGVAIVNPNPNPNPPDTYLDEFVTDWNRYRVVSSDLSPNIDFRFPLLDHVIKSFYAHVNGDSSKENGGD